MAKDPRCQPILLLATDFDGTLYRYGRNADIYPPFAELLARMRADGAVWMVCSGRPLSSIGKATRRMAHEGVSPDIIVARHSWVYVQRGGQWFLQIPMTLRLHWDTWRRRRELNGLTKRLAGQISSTYASCRKVSISPQHVRLQFPDPAEASDAYAMATRLCGDAGVRMAQWQREVEIRTAPCAKALAVLDVARRRGITPAHTLAIGDGRSDLGMLSPAVAAMTGCPLNATREVIQAVLEAGGHVADAEALAGTLQAIRAWLDGCVNSVAPATWRPPRGELGNGAAARDERRRRAGRALDAAIVVGSVLIGLAALDLYSGAGFLSGLVRTVWSAFTDASPPFTGP